MPSRDSRRHLAVDISINEVSEWLALDYLLCTSHDLSN